MGRFDICAVGHVTSDLITDAHGHRRNAIGGSTYYAGIAFASLGLRTLVVSAVAKRDMETFGAAFESHDVAVQFVESSSTTSFENSYAGTDGRRSQRIGAIARAFNQSDLSHVDADAVHLGPLTPGELPLDCVAFLARQGARLSLDIQGFVRDVSDGTVRTVEWPQKADFLRHVSVVKANRWEAQAVTASRDPATAARHLASLGPDEVIVTLADRGAILCIDGELHEIPAKPVRISRDPTGCGDSFCAGYIFARLRGRSPRESAVFAACLAAEKQKHEGPFTGTVDAIDALITG